MDKFTLTYTGFGQDARDLGDILTNNINTIIFKIIWKLKNLWGGRVHRDVWVEATANGGRLDKGNLLKKKLFVLF